MSFIAALGTGVVFGLSAGISPGPLLALVVSETLKYGWRSGVKVALAPLITDGPIILISLFLIFYLSNIDFLLGLISLLGAGFIGYLSFEVLTAKAPEVENTERESHSFKKGIITNALSPHPYLFYFSVGGPIILRAYETSVWSSAAFLIGFNLLLVGSKVGIAAVVSRSRSFLKSRMYLCTLKGLGIVLVIFAFLFLREAARYLF